MITSTAAEQRSQEVAKVLMHRRMDKGMTRRELAERLDVSEATIYRAETQKAKYMRIETLIEIANELDMDVEIEVKPRSS